MLHYFKFRQNLFAPQPARPTYHKPRPGHGWPDQCPPIRAANSFGFDLLANFDVVFIQTRAGWRVQPDIIIDSDFDWFADDAPPGAPGTPGRPLKQQYAWFWQKGQTLPHRISDNVYRHIRHQVKISSFLFMHTDANELMLMTGVPDTGRPWRTLSALVDSDWYPASYPWHIVLELDATQKRIPIQRGTPLCRVIPVRRDAYFARQMSPQNFDDFFTRGQKWLSAHGRPHPGVHDGTLNITHTYARQQISSTFTVLP